MRVSFIVTVRYQGSVEEEVLECGMGTVAEEFTGESRLKCGEDGHSAVVFVLFCASADAARSAKGRRVWCMLVDWARAIVYILKDDSECIRKTWVQKVAPVLLIP